MTGARWENLTVWWESGALWYVGEGRPDILEYLAGEVTLTIHPKPRGREIVEPYPEQGRITSEKRWRQALENLEVNYSTPDGCLVLENFQPPLDEARRITGQGCLLT